jgi:light-independent protochlorophyllide reductase subunit B
MDIDVNMAGPMGARPADIARMGAAHFNVLLYPETAESAARHCETAFNQPFTKTIPIGVAATRAFIEEVAALAKTSLRPDESRLRQPWWAASVDSTYLTGKRVFLFGDATHVIAAARIAAREIGFEVVGMGCYNREQARPLRAAAREYGLEALITDDYLEVEAAIAELHPELILGTQMERHIGKRLGIPCAVISAPVHVQDFPARHSPQMGFEGANVIFDTWIHPLVMGLEEHLLHMFRDDFEFNDAAGPSHHGGHAPRVMQQSAAPVSADVTAAPGERPAIPAESPVPDNIVWLRARQGPPQHRSLCGRKGLEPDRRRDAIRGKSPLCAMNVKPPATGWSSSPSTVTRRGPPRASCRSCRTTSPACPSRYLRPPNGEAIRSRSPNVRPHFSGPTSSWRICCS